MSDVLSANGFVAPVQVIAYVIAKNFSSVT